MKWLNKDVISKPACSFGNLEKTLTRSAVHNLNWRQTWLHLFYLKAQLLLHDVSVSFTKVLKNNFNWLTIFSHTHRVREVLKAGLCRHAQAQRAHQGHGEHLEYATQLHTMNRFVYSGYRTVPTWIWRFPVLGVIITVIWDKRRGWSWHLKPFRWFKKQRSGFIWMFSLDRAAEFVLDRSSLVFSDQNGHFKPLHAPDQMLC